MTAEDPTLRLRVARPRDAAAMLAIYAPIVRDTAISFELEPPTEREFANKLETVLATHPWIVAEDAEGLLAGYAYATSFRARPAYDWTCESSVYVAAGHRGRGVGHLLGTVLIDLLAGQGFTCVVAGIALPNEPSRVLHRRLGYREVGVVERAGVKFGNYHAVEFWERALGADAAAPAKAPTEFARWVAGGGLAGTRIAPA
ncbi:GNAT family N-acetyltransferase [Engelhardtia mirabilis]|uniref:Phosphinothricin N-acetyltransferase n=1 Tax=Engelhardtia mirabilis TaxID=2528011 RepID=A0A518BHB1_9BACT|nr:Phosphinothricin N-acetyltransferase [Planctomycetes bacterium Pla133]QDV00698.1 Phosphinothricin N-acetyltransferase [Planctomycetes bacterium Pla86]